MPIDALSTYINVLLQALLNAYFLFFLHYSGSGNKIYTYGIKRSVSEAHLKWIKFAKKFSALSVWRFPIAWFNIWLQVDPKTWSEKVGQ